jgi:hypothetical protein
MRQGFEPGPMPNASHSIEFAQQLQQHRLPAGRIGCRGAGSAGQFIGVCALFLVGDLLWWRWPVMDRYRFTCIAARYHPRTVMIIHDQLLVFHRDISTNKEERADRH